MSQERRFPLTPSQLQELICTVTQQITQSVAHIDLTPCELEPDPHQDLCFVYTTLSGVAPVRLVLCAERTFLQRLTENILGHSTSDPEDLEEYTIEFFNVLIGRLVGEFYRATHIGARFHPPLFGEGHYTAQLASPEALKNSVSFSDSNSEHIMIVHDDF